MAQKTEAARTYPEDWNAARVLSEIYKQQDDRVGHRIEDGWSVEGAELREVRRATAAVAVSIQDLNYTLLLLLKAATDDKL